MAEGPVGGVQWGDAADGRVTLDALKAASRVLERMAAAEGAEPAQGDVAPDAAPPAPLPAWAVGGGTSAGATGGTAPNLTAQMVREVREAFERIAADMAEAREGAAPAVAFDADPDVEVEAFSRALWGREVEVHRRAAEAIEAENREYQRRIDNIEDAAQRSLRQIWERDLDGIEVILCQRVTKARGVSLADFMGIAQTRGGGSASGPGFNRAMRELLRAEAAEVRASSILEDLSRVEI